jgi:hypothetical protein
MIEISKLDNFLYLLSEMEGALALGGIGWSATTAVNVRERLNRGHFKNRYHR